MKKFEFDPDIVPNVKLGIHSFQIIFTFVAWCIEIAVFRAKDAEVNGLNGWTFGVCFLSIPAWIYLIMTPRFSRTRKFAQPHAMLAVDAVFTVLWLSAFATQASYNAKDQCGKACGISKAIVGLGVFITLFFAGSTFISAYTLTYSNFHGNLPGYDNRKLRGGENIDPDKAAFSMAPHDDEAYERVNMDEQEPTGSQYNSNTYSSNTYNSSTNQYTEGNPYSTEDDDPSRYGALPHRTNTLFDNDTEYNSGAPPSMPYANPPAGNAYDDHLDHVNDPYNDPHNDHLAQFPPGNYDRTH
ncbi:hypothetical protein QQX98_010895 [Neonectria punicea]|uniref:MARVEL domain-containing protein n=1 Tax=Neonectria punicea TaxID=979145 RepID=A0ABR1GN73_9HYPO